jgi:hypothetical protein
MSNRKEQKHSEENYIIRTKNQVAQKKYYITGRVENIQEEQLGKF